ISICPNRRCSCSSRPLPGGSACSPRMRMRYACGIGFSATEMRCWFSALAVTESMQPRFEVAARCGAARLGRLTAAHGVIETPAFLPIGTYGTVKAMTPEELEALGAEIILGNSFHLMLRPGPEIIAAHGGLHRFMNWRRPI